MNRAIRAEFRKLLTVRSTYFLTLLIIGLSCLFTYIGTGPEYVDKNNPNISASQADAAAQKPEQKQSKPQEFTPPTLVKTNNLQPDKLANNIIDTTGAAIFIAVAVVLLMAHEFRYNTITYSLTASNSRSRFLLAKILVSISYVLMATLLAVLVTVATTYLAVNVRNLNLPHQDIKWLYVNARLVGYILGFSLLGLALITLIRNLTAAIVALFFLPVADNLLSTIFTKNHMEPANYLPFSALNRLTSNNISTPPGMPSVAHSALVFFAYLLVLWLITWYLFLKRDAN